MLYLVTKFLEFGGEDGGDAGLARLLTIIVIVLGLFTSYGWGKGYWHKFQRDRAETKVITLNNTNDQLEQRLAAEQKNNKKYGELLESQNAQVQELLSQIERGSQIRSDLRRLAADADNRRQTLEAEHDTRLDQIYKDSPVARDWLDTTVPCELRGVCN